MHIGKLTLVDLAGSERVGKTGAKGEILREAQAINKSLLEDSGLLPRPPAERKRAWQGLRGMPHGK